MNLTLADMVPNLTLPSFETVSSAAFCVGKAAYQAGSLTLAIGAGVYVAVEVINKINNPTISKIIGFVAGLLTTMAVFALTNPFTPLNEVFLFSAVVFSVTSLFIGAWAENVVREVEKELTSSFVTTITTLAVMVFSQFIFKKS